MTLGMRGKEYLHYENQGEEAVYVCVYVYFMCMCVNLRHVCGRIPSGAGLCRVTSFLPSFPPPADPRGGLLQVFSAAHDTGYSVGWLHRARGSSS